ncbi:MAG: YbhB/YbcL family Raf kinase inhibitor-like protein [Bacteroidota bacterium]|nr:YbhB/YbcL family Raf kinase inhibitor-like protein [Bacteroidota bacterium]
MIVESKSFKHEEFIPQKYTCDGANISPDLEWSGFSGNTKSFALICNDPDAPSGNWIHWVLFNIPAHVNHLGEHFLIRNRPVPEMTAGVNDSRQLEYRGPCPPGGIHRYYFRIYALDEFIKAKEGITALELQSLMKGHILGQGEIMGRYKR